MLFISLTTLIAVSRTQQVNAIQTSCDKIYFDHLQSHGKLLFNFVKLCLDGRDYLSCGVKLSID